MDLISFIDFLSLTIRRNLTVSHVLIDLRLYRLLVNIERRKIEELSGPGGIIINLFEEICGKIYPFSAKIRILHISL